MDSVALVARLKDGAEPRARELLAAGPPSTLERTAWCTTPSTCPRAEVVFVFSGEEVEWSVDDLVSEPFQWRLQEGARRLAGRRGWAAADRPSGLLLEQPPADPEFASTRGVAIRAGAAPPFGRVGAQNGGRFATPHRSPRGPQGGCAIALATSSAETTPEGARNTTR